ncbi:MAG TPA: hypothetical protein PLD25_18840 [Chloroflexota bacterium]|nr:hypothetical protein [Chloroflexota bacterium]HUM68483.1 hypothetical protein [Chloroflexota bacterium]
MAQTEAQQTVAGIAFSNETPTRLAYEELYTWVIWQFPRPQNGGLIGAVHPPTPQHGWIPAVIFGGKKHVEIYAHLNERYPTPESAAEYFQAQIADT